MRFALDKETEKTETRKKENDAWNTELTLFFPPRFSAPTKPHQNLLLAGKVCVLFSGFACCVFFPTSFCFLVYANGALFQYFLLSVFWLPACLFVLLRYLCVLFSAWSLSDCTNPYYVDARVRQTGTGVGL